MKLKWLINEWSLSLSSIKTKTHFGTIRHECCDMCIEIEEFACIWVLDTGDKWFVSFASVHWKQFAPFKNNFKISRCNIVLTAVREFSSLEVTQNYVI